MALFSIAALVLTLIAGFGTVAEAAQTPESSQADASPVGREEASGTSAEFTPEVSETPSTSTAEATGEAPEAEPNDASDTSAEAPQDVAETPVATSEESNSDSGENPIAQDSPSSEAESNEVSIAVEDRPAPVSKARAMAARLANPQLPAQCGLSVAIVLDLSNSLKDSDVASSKTAAQGVVEALTGTPSAVGVYTFASLAPDGTNTALTKTSVSTSQGAASVKNSIAGIKRVPVNRGGTNWDAALRQIPAGGYDIVLFVTDGNPTAYGTPNPDGRDSTPRNNTDMGSGFNAIDLSTALAAANALKASGSFVMGLGVGSDLNVSNIRDISGARENTDYFLIENYAELAQKLSEIALKNCQGTVSIVKQVRDLTGKLAPAAGWTFDARSVDNVEPLSAVTSKDGAVNFKVKDLMNDRRTIEFAERQQSGYALEQQNGYNAVCTDNTTGQRVSVNNVGATGFAVDIRRENALSCQVINRMIPSEPIVVKTSNPASGTEVQPGDEIQYKLTFSTEGRFPADVDYLDYLENVLDDADLVAGSVAADSGLNAVLSGKTLKITGTVSEGKPLSVTYKVNVRTKGFGDGKAVNFVVPNGQIPPAECEPEDTSCTEHPIAGNLVVDKSSDPKSGTPVQPGQTVNYILSFANTGASAVEVSYLDHLADVLDDADLVAGSLKAGQGLEAALIGDSLRITGKVEPESTLSVTYSASIKNGASGNGIAKNFLMPDGEDPRCDPEKTNCTEHPVQGSVIWDKVDGNGAALAGSEWKLTGPDGFNGGKALQIQDCIADSTEECSGADEDPEAGSFKLASLAWGDYILVETKAPAGYTRDDIEHRFTVAGSGDGRIIWDLGSVENKQRPTLALPLTGGNGTQAFLLGGSAVLLAALGAVAWRRKMHATKN